MVEQRSDLKQKAELSVVSLGSSPLPIRIQIPQTLSARQLKILQESSMEGRPLFFHEIDRTYKLYAYKEKENNEEHMALIKNLGNGEDVPIRIHSSCVTAETFHASNCDCGEQIQAALLTIEKEGCGGIIWLHQEGRGNGLKAKVQQLKLMMERGLDTVDAFEQAGYPKDKRNYAAAADILKELGVKSVRVITNNPDKIKQIENLGITVTGRLPCEIPAFNEIVRKDLQAKKDKLGHMIHD